MRSRRRQALGLAGIARYFRQNHSLPTASLIEVFALVAAGYDNVEALVTETGLSESTVRRLLHHLRGSPRCRGSRDPSRLSLVVRFRHPHLQGSAYGWRLSPQGESIAKELDPP